MKKPTHLFAFLFGLLFATSAFAAGKVLHVYNWSDYIAGDTVANFEKATGIKVVYDVYDGNEALETRLFAGRSGYDVIFPSAHPFGNRHVALNLYAPLDKSRLPNFIHMDADLLTILATGDKNNAHMLPYMWGTTGLGYNKTKVEALLGKNAPLDSWALIFDVENAKKLATCGISMLNDEQESMAAALLYLGKNINTINPKEIDAAATLLTKVRPYIKYFHSSQYINDLANGDTCVAHGYSGDIFQARVRAKEAQGKVVIGYSIPKEGAVIWVDVMAIPKDAPHPLEAHAFINYLMTPKVIADVSNFVSYANGNKAATALVDEAIRNDKGVYPTPAVRTRLVVMGEIPAKAQRLRTKMWTRVKTGR